VKTTLTLASLPLSASPQHFIQSTVPRSKEPFLMLDPISTQLRSTGSLALIAFGNRTQPCIFLTALCLQIPPAPVGSPLASSSAGNASVPFRSYTHLFLQVGDKLQGWPYRGVILDNCCLDSFCRFNCKS